jgi:hypothetical protein
MVCCEDPLRKGAPLRPVGCPYEVTPEELHPLASGPSSLPCVAMAYGRCTGIPSATDPPIRNQEVALSFHEVRTSPDLARPGFQPKRCISAVMHERAPGPVGFIQGGSGRSN